MFADCTKEIRGGEFKGKLALTNLMSIMCLEFPALGVVGREGKKEERGGEKECATSFLLHTRITSTAHKHRSCLLIIFPRLRGRERKETDLLLLLLVRSHFCRFP